MILHYGVHKEGTARAGLRKIFSPSPPLLLLVLLVPINPCDKRMTTSVASNAWLGFLSGLELSWLLADLVWPR